MNDLKHHYWIWLLLFAHIMLYLIVLGFNTSDDPEVNVLVTVLLVSGIFFYKGHFGQVYTR